MLDDVVINEIPQVEEEVKQEAVETVEPSVEVAEKPKGHLSYEAWIKAGRDPEDYKGSKAFQKDGELFEYIKNSNKERKELKEGLQTLLDQQKKIALAEYKKGLEDAKAQLRQAASIGDVKTVEALTESISELKAQAPQAVNPEAVNNARRQAAVNDFLSRNADWLDASKDENIEMIAYMKQIDNIALGDTPEEHVAIVEKKIKEKFSHRFIKQVKQTPISMEGDNIKKDTKKISLADLPDDLKKQYRLLEGSIKNFNGQNYLQRLKNSGVI